MGPADQSVKMNNEGEFYTPNRAARRKKPIVDRNFTKSTHKDKKRKDNNVERIEYRKRATNRARKANQEDTTQLS